MAEIESILLNGVHGFFNLVSGSMDGILGIVGYSLSEMIQRYAAQKVSLIFLGRCSWRCDDSMKMELHFAGDDASDAFY